MRHVPLSKMPPTRNNSANQELAKAGHCHGSMLAFTVPDIQKSVIIRKKRKRGQRGKEREKT